MPHASVAVHVIVVVPQRYESVNGRSSLRVPVTVGAGSQLSTTVGVPGSSTAEHSPGSLHFSMSDGQVISGGIVSSTVIV